MCGHRVQFYDDEAFLQRRVLEFLMPAAGDGAGLLVIATREHARSLQPLLREDAEDRLTWCDAHETLAAFMVDGMPDPARFRHAVGDLLARASAGGTRSVRAFGEMVAVLAAEGSLEAAVRLEQLWQELTAQHGLALLCAYPMSAFPDEGHRHAFGAICDAHTHVDALEPAQDAAHDPARLHRVIADLRRQVQVLEHELARRPAAPGAAAAPEPPLVVWMTVEDAARKLRLSRPHVIKLIAEHRLRDVVHAGTGAPLISPEDVDRVALEMRAAGAG